MHLSNVQAERLGDTKQPVRLEACNVLLALMQVLRKELVLEKLGKYWSHKNWRVRHGMLQTFAEAVAQFGTGLTSVKDSQYGLLPNVLKLIEDPDRCDRTRERQKRQPQGRDNCCGCLSSFLSSIQRNNVVLISLSCLAAAAAPLAVSALRACARITNNTAARCGTRLPSAWTSCT